MSSARPMINRKLKILMTTAVFTVVFSIYGCAPLKPVEPEKVDISIAINITNF